MRLGDRGTRILWLILVCIPFVISIALGLRTMLALGAIPLMVLAARPILRGAQGRDLIPVLGLTGRAMLLWSVITALALS